MCVRERPMIWLAMTMQIASFPKISRKLFIRCYWKILLKFSTYPDPLEWVLLLKDRTTTESLNQSQAACCSIDHKIWLATVSHYVISTIRGHKYNGTTSLVFSTRPKPVSCFRPESNLLPVSTRSKPSWNGPTRKENNQQTHQPKRKICDPNSGFQTTAKKTIKQEKLLRTTDE